MGLAGKFALTGFGEWNGSEANVIEFYGGEFSLIQGPL